MVAQGVDDEERPFFAYDVYDSFDGAEAEVVAFVGHFVTSFVDSCYVAINFVV